MADRAADILVEDRSGIPRLIVECKSTVAGADVEHALAAAANGVPSVAFAMLVDPERIRVYRVGTGGLTLAVALDAAGVFSHYEPRFGATRVYEHTLVTLSSAWLRDLMDHWRGPTPPGESELQRAGLLPIISGGWTRVRGRIRQVRASGHLAEFGAMRLRLEEALLLADRALVEVRSRLSVAVEAAAGRFDLTPMAPADARAAVADVVCEQPTDNLILHTILRHAGADPDPSKAYFTQNLPDFVENGGRDRLRAAGVTALLGSREALDGWLAAAGREPDAGGA